MPATCRPAGGQTSQRMTACRSSPCSRSRPRAWPGSASPTPSAQRLTSRSHRFPARRPDQPTVGSEAVWARNLCRKTGEPGRLSTTPAFTSLRGHSLYADAGVTWWLQGSESVAGHARADQGRPANGLKTPRGSDNAAAAIRAKRQRGRREIGGGPRPRLASLKVSGHTYLHEGAWRER